MYCSLYSNCLQKYEQYLNCAIIIVVFLKMDHNRRYGKHLVETFPHAFWCSKRLFTPIRVRFFTKTFLFVKKRMRFCSKIFFLHKYACVIALKIFFLYKYACVIAPKIFFLHKYACVLVFLKLFLRFYVGGGVLIFRSFSDSLWDVRIIHFPFEQVCTNSDGINGHISSRVSSTCPA